MKGTEWFRRSGVLIIAAMLAMTAAASAQRMGRPGMGGHPQMGDPTEMFNRMAEKLNLTDAQKSQISTIVDQFKSQNAGTLSEVKTLGETMRQKIQEKDRDGAKQIAEQIKAKMELIQPAREEMMTKIRGVLTSDQQAQLDEMMQKRMKRGDRGNR